MRKFSTGLMIFLNCSLLLIQWQCSRSSNKEAPPHTPSENYIPPDWSGSSDDIPDTLQVRELE